MHTIKILTLLLLVVVSVHSQIPWDNLICDCGCVKTEFRAPCDTQFDNRNFNKYAGFTNPSCSVTQISDLPDCSTRTILCDTIWNCCNDNGDMKCTAALQRVTTGKCRRYTCADTDDTCCYDVECTCSLSPTTPQMITTSITTTTTKPSTTTPPLTTLLAITTPQRTTEKQITTQQTTTKRPTTTSQPTTTEPQTTEKFDSTPPIDINTEQIRTTSPEDRYPTPPSKPGTTLTTSGNKNPATDKPSKPNSGTAFHGIDRYLLILLFLMAAVIAIQV